MTHLVNDPAHLATEALAGFVAAHAGTVVGVDGGVLRATASPPGQVALVVGGGSGHYPAFAGWVGPGMAHAAVAGHVFASPSARQVHDVATAAHRGGGVLLAYGNYAGDVLNFEAAARRLRAEGVDVRTLAISDDVASGPVQDRLSRRGVAGDLCVVKIAGAAAEAGLDLDGVERVARAANAATATFGVAFSGCTLPGASEPLFTVPPGRMALGLGVHGEPGLAERALGTADEVADLLLDAVLAEEPERAGGGGYCGRVAVLVDGLGSTTPEELFVLYRRVDQRLGERGLVVVDPHVGELMTSLDMAGVSLTVCYLDAETEGFWTAPAATAAVSRGVVPPRELRTDDPTAAASQDLPPASAASRRAAGQVAAAFAAVRDVLAGAAERLGRIDAVAGDGDHGSGMERGSAAAATAAAEAVAGGAGVRTVLLRAGDAWAEQGGGTSGALWGAALSAAGDALGDEDALDAAALLAAASAGGAAITELGGARPGDKTMVDALVPWLEALEVADPDGVPWAAAAAAATRAAEGTAEFSARRGRAKTHGDASLGTPDAGAVSFALIVTALAERSGR